MDEKLEGILIEMSANLASIAVSLRKIADSSERIEISEEVKIPLAQDSVYRAVANMETGPKYKEHSEIGKGPVMEKTCGKEVCRCLRNDGSCAAHHPEFCPKCRKLNNI